jgi:hypothetical protein
MIHEASDDEQETGMTRSRVGQVEAPLDTLDTDIHPIKPVRHIGILVLEITDALLYLADIIAHVIDSASNVTQMLKNDVVCLSHFPRLAWHRGIVNHGRLIQPGMIHQAPDHRVSFLYFTRCGMTESWPNLRILSFS